jgi:CDP-glucose 4,6-dehydratase
VARRARAMEDLGLSMSWEGRRVLVTGHTGFKGGWLCLWLARRGARVCGCSLEPPTEPSLYRLARVGEAIDAQEQLDVRDRGALAAAFAAHPPEVVFHLAAQPLVRRSFSAPVETFEVNAGGTANVLECVRTCGSVRVALIVTTDKVYAEQPGGAPHAEGDPLGGADPYSASKACAELVAGAYRESFMSRPGSPAIATARAGNVIGGGDFGVDRLVPDLVRAAAAGGAIELRNPDAIRPWQHVLNPLSGYLALAESLWESADAQGGWNFGPGACDERPVAWVAERFAQLWGETPGWRQAAGAAPRETPVLRLDSSKAGRLLGWQPRWDLERGLAETVDWHRRVQAGEDARAVTLDHLGRFER